MTTPTVTHGAVEYTPVHFDDLDAMGILHNSRYAVLVERAVGQWWADRGVSFTGGRPTSPDAFNAVREYSITFHLPVTSVGDIAVHFWLAKLGTTSADYRFRVTSPDGAAVYAEGRRVNIRLDPATMRPAPWTDHARDLAAALVEA
jgi:acyl-CoA thioester hydrolase